MAMQMTPKISCPQRPDLRRARAASTSIEAAASLFFADGVDSPFLVEAVSSVLVIGVLLVDVEVEVFTSGRYVYFSSSDFGEFARGGIPRSREILKTFNQLVSYLAQLPPPLWVEAHTFADECQTKSDRSVHFQLSHMTHSQDGRFLWGMCGVCRGASRRPRRTESGPCGRVRATFR